MARLQVDAVRLCGRTQYTRPRQEVSYRIRYQGGEFLWALRYAWIFRHNFCRSLLSNTVLLAWEE